jgi:hypothetical protein
MLQQTSNAESNTDFGLATPLLVRYAVIPAIRSVNAEYVVECERREACPSWPVGDASATGSLSTRADQDTTADESTDREAGPHYPRADELSSSQSRLPRQQDIVYDPITETCVCVDHSAVPPIWLTRSLITKADCDPTSDEPTDR